MKLLFVTDLHGSIWKYERTFQLAKFLAVDAVVNGGDMLPYADNIFDQGKFVVNYLDQYFARYDAAGIYHLGLLGNDDLRIFDGLFFETCHKYQRVFDVAQRKVDIGDREFIGMNWVSDYPFRLKDRCRMDTADFVFEKQLGTALLSTPSGLQEVQDWFGHARGLPTNEEELKRLPAPRNPSQSIYMIHMPPAGLGLDKLFDGRGVGAWSVYRFLEKMQPSFSLHGHIHESPDVSGCWQAALGNTSCIQPGQLKESELVYVVIDTSLKKVTRMKESK